MKLTILHVALVLTLNCGATRAAAQPATNTAYSQPPSSRLSVAQLDAESQRCMACHSGAFGQHIELRPAGAPLEFEYGRTVRTRNHAIGMEYQIAYEANPQEYVAPAALDRNIRLVEGKVGCLSCHIKREELIVQATSYVPVSDMQCSNDNDALQKVFRGPNCLKCHIK
ncbi:MAG: hypothetical protein HY961_01030 [Ignavibacteriae bacterium]|nr:hypothetical protein [Ignavibacteriota bacterium]